MRTNTSFSILTAGILAFGCAAAEKPAPNTGLPGGATPVHGATTAEPSPFPAEPASEGGIARGESEPGNDDEALPEQAPAAPPASAEASAGSGTSADAPSPRSRASLEPKKSSRPLDIEPERPGLGTTWGESMTSHVSNAPFERASGGPFSVASIHYNDATGIGAMLSNASFASFRADRPPIDNGMLTVRVTDGSGSSLPTFVGNGRTLVQGEMGQRYMIEIENHSSSRFEAVVTVDGLDVIDGKAGTLSKRGYLVQPFATVEIDGFRQSMDQVAAFRFGSVRGSYAAGKGGARNVGVIGVAFFAERGATRPWTDREISRREAADPFPGRFASPPIAR